ncbi:hypothetical protein AB0J52_31450 [Spirillospora sp. NPDC049652]
MDAKGERDDDRDGRPPARRLRVAAGKLAVVLQRWARVDPSEGPEPSERREPSERPDPSVGPDPAAARTTAEFAEQLRRLKRYSGATYRGMSDLNGGSPVVSTLSTADKGEKLPSERVLRAYLRGCHLDEEAMTPWLEARGRIAMQES